MRRLLVKIIKGEKGQALPIVLIVLLLGGLMVTPCLDYAATNLSVGRNVEKNVDALYAADSGIEDVMWKLKNDPPASYPYSCQLQDVNGLSVDILVEELTTIYGVVVGSSGEHADWLGVSGELVYNEDLEVSIYTVTVVNKSESTVKLSQILVKLPPDYEYIAGSTDGDFTTTDPEIELNLDTGTTVLWDFGSPRPALAGAPDPEGGVYTIGVQTFQLNGPIEYSGDNDYVWVITAETDIGCVGEASAYKITAQAKDGGTVVKAVKVGVLDDSVTGALLISCWEIDPPSAGG